MGFEFMQEETFELITMLRRFQDETYAEAWITGHRWPGGVRCPMCDSSSVVEVEDRVPMPYRCRDCVLQFSVKSRSPMQGSKIPLSVWAQAFYLSSSLTNPVLLDLRVILTIPTRSAWEIAQRIRKAWDTVYPDQKDASGAVVTAGRKRRHGRPPEAFPGSGGGAARGGCASVF